MRTINKERGAFWRKCRTAAGLSKVELAEKLGFSNPASVATMESRGSTTQSRLEKLWEVLPETKPTEFPLRHKKGSETLSFGAALEQVRLGQGLSQVRAAKMVGFATAESWRRLELGKQTLLKRKTFNNMLTSFPELSALNFVQPELLGAVPTPAPTAVLKQETLRVKKLSDAAKMAGVTGGSPKEATFTRSFARALIQLVKVDGIEQVKAFLMAARTSGLSLTDTLNELDAL